MNGHSEIIDIFNLEAKEAAALDAQRLQDYHRIDVTGMEFYEIGKGAKKVEQHPEHFPFGSSHED